MAKRDKPAAIAFFQKAIKGSGHPRKIVIDKSGFNTAALEEINQENTDKIEVYRVKYLNNIVEQWSRFIKKITRPALGLKSFSSARTALIGIEVAHIIRKAQIPKPQNNSSNFEIFKSLIAA